MIIPGHKIRHHIKIEPYVKRTEERFQILNEGIAPPFRLSYGESHAGYDLRLEKVLVGQFDSQIVNELEEPHTIFSSAYGNSFVLGSVMEYIEMPDDVIGIVHDKSTLARLGLAVQNTVIEPGWKGYLTVEISNHGSHDIYLHKGMPICQVIFHRFEESAVPYEGKYQNQPDRPVNAK